MSRPDAAIATRLASLASEDAKAKVGKKLRVAGKVLCHDRKRGMMLLWNDEHAILVDIALCLVPNSSGQASEPWLLDMLSTVFVFGYLEYPDGPLQVPDPPAHYPPGKVLVIEDKQMQATLVQHAPHTDLRAWDATVAKMEALGAWGVLPRSGEHAR
ncbi:hypothetical protein OF83DRAFT_305581 [Amylostereum chailletii]|nr:hypothetical protein OF83DRAFT_305581 [Amylostereum chailletii]